MSPAFAGNGGDGYVTPSYREFAQTMAMLGGVDITNAAVADEYAKLVHCGLYQKNYKNDLEWYDIRSKIISRVLERKEHFRVLYETTGVFKLGRYDIDEQLFPLSPDTAMVNVGAMFFFSTDAYEPFCGQRKPSRIFPRNISFVLKKPLTLNVFRVPPDEVKKMMARMTKIKNLDRLLYGRIRFRVLQTPGPIRVKDKVVRAELHGEITAIDFFLDREMTQPAGIAQFSR